MVGIEEDGPAGGVVSRSTTRRGDEGSWFSGLGNGKAQESRSSSVDDKDAEAEKVIKGQAPDHAGLGIQRVQHQHDVYWTGEYA